MFSYHLTGPAISHPMVLCKKVVVRNFAKFTGTHLCRSLFFNKAAGLRPAFLLKKRLWQRCFPVNFAKFLRTPFTIEHIWWLLLEYYCFITIVNINFFRAVSINSETTLKYYHKQTLKTKLKMMGGSMKYFSKKLLGHEIFSFMVFWTTNLFSKKKKRKKKRKTNTL